jgi:hypothetical protein
MVLMKRILLTIGLLVFVLFGVSKVMAQSTEPGLGLPLLDDTSTAVATTTAVANQSTTIYSTITPISGSTTTMLSSTNQSAVDDAETGSEMVVLVILSITGGVGIFLIKKYFDFKRYSI